MAFPDSQPEASPAQASALETISRWEMTADFAWGPELRRAFLVALFPVLVLLLHQRFDSAFELVDDDAIVSWQPVFTDFARQLRSGQMPVWSHHTQCGFPLLGWPQPTFVYPINWFSHLICTLLGWDSSEIFITTLLHYFLAAAGTYVFLRRFGIVMPAAVTASYAYAFSGILLGLGAMWPIYVFTAALWPLVLLTIEELRTGKGGRFWVPFLGLLGGLGFLSIDLLVMIKYSLFAGLYFLLRAHPPTFRANLKQLALAGLLAILIGLGQLVPSAEIILTSIRMGTGGTDALTTPPTLWLGLIYPFWMLPWESGIRAAGGFFVGPCALLGAVFACRSFLSLRGPHRALLILASVYLGLALGHHWYPSVALHSLPVFSAFRWPMRWMFEASAALALLSGFGLHLAYEQLGRNEGRGTVLAFLAICFFVLLMRYPAPPGMALRATLMMLVWGAGLAGLWWTAHPVKRTGFLYVVCLWTVTAMLANIPVAQLTVMSRMTQLLKDPLPVGQDTQERVLFLARQTEVEPAQCQGTLAFSLPHQFQTRTVFGYVYRPPEQSWMQGIDFNGLIKDDEPGIARRFLGPSSTLLATLRVGHVVVSKKNLILDQACQARPDLKPLRETEFYRIYRHLGFKEPAFFVRVLKPEESREDLVELGVRLQLPHEALVEPGYSGPKQFSGDGAVQDFHEHHGHLSMRVHGKYEGFLVVTTTHFPRWRATIDGAETPVFRANGSFLGLRVPPGQHDIDLVYWPADHLVLLAISGLALLLVIAWIVGLGFWTRTKVLSPFSTGC
jgi:hypothetical protein